MQTGRGKCRGPFRLAHQFKGWTAAPT